MANEKKSLAEKLKENWKKSKEDQEKSEKKYLAGMYKDTNLEKIGLKAKPMIIVIGIVLLMLFFVVPFIIGLFSQIIFSNVPVVIVAILVAGIIIYYGGFK